MGKINVKLHLLVASKYRKPLSRKKNNCIFTHKKQHEIYIFFINFLINSMKKALLSLAVGLIALTANAQGITSVGANIPVVPSWKYSPDEEWTAMCYAYQTGTAYNFNGQDLFLCHGYSVELKGASVLIQKEIRWTDDGWPWCNK